MYTIKHGTTYVYTSRSSTYVLVITQVQGEAEDVGIVMKIIVWVRSWTKLIWMYESWFAFPNTSRNKYFKHSIIYKSAV